MIQSREAEGVATVIYVARVESPGLFVCSTVLELWDPIGPAHKDGDQPIIGDRRSGARLYTEKKERKKR